ncbi:MAG: Rpn family recombination-promoting nuclease/putative transposase [Treponema sp.]|nr:Rpn family recombination-promoting nuclease/putative transposase [Treponema sp.]
MEKREYHMKRIEDLTFTDDGMFQAVLHEPGICAELVERLLHVKVGRIEYPELEKTIAPFYSSKGVRLDVYLKDSDKVIDVEMQSYPQEAVGLRMRYYQSMIDTDSLLKGQDYPELPASYILFICRNAPFMNENNKAYGLPRYTFRTQCIEDNAVNLDDKTLKVIYNASAYREEKDEEVRAFLKYVYTNDPGKDGFSSRLSAIVEDIKLNDIFRSQYAAMNLHDKDLIRWAKKEALAQGASQKAVEAAEMFLREGDSVEKVSRCIGLPLEQVKEIATRIAVMHDA